MVWATVSSQSCFCWLYRASPSLASKNIINLISVLTIWWCPCVESSLVFLEECVCYEPCILLAKLLACALLHSVFQGQISFYPRCFLPSYFCIPVPYNEKDIFYWVLVLKGLVGLHRTVQLQLLQRYWLGHRLGLLWYWMVCLGSKQRSFCRFTLISNFYPRTVREHICVILTLSHPPPFVLRVCGYLLQGPKETNTDRVRGT